MANLKEATKAGLDSENLAIIKARLEKAMEEIADAKKMAQ